MPIAAPGAGTYILSASPGSFALIGAAAGFARPSRVLVASAGAFAVTGVATGGARGRFLAAAAGSFALAAPAAGGGRGRGLLASPGSFALAGVGAAPAASRRLVASASAFALAGLPAAFSVQTSTAFVLACTAGSFALAGADARPVSARRASAAPGSFALAAPAAGVRASRRLSASPGSFALIVAATAPDEVPMPTATVSASLTTTARLAILYDFGDTIAPSIDARYPAVQASTAIPTPTLGWASPLTIGPGAAVVLNLTALAGASAPVGVTVTFAQISMLSVSVNQAVGSGLDALVGGEGSGGEWQGPLSAGATIRAKAGIALCLGNADAGGWPVASPGAHLLKIANPNASAIDVSVGLAGR